ncbi:hypothetical protein POTOM_044532 [Populus tomentosa]|uniref:Uncharacterized protein n=1 Tax=Populus tomentosa TaxID=118781 RepID=A0A8X7YJM0_POPTO|nr:hypothetical protein POTOM_044532 [Populus tomentosa]
MVSICKRQCFFAFILILGTWAYEVASRELQEPSMSARHEQWMATYGKVYADAADKERRFEIFKDNVEYIESFSTAGKKPYKLSVNKFADLTNEELKVAREGYRRPLQTRPMKVTSFKYENVTAVLATMDWRKKGKLVSLSEQELVDCDTQGEDQGCEGGLMEDGFDFIIKNHGITTDANYPYQAADGTCNSKKEASRIAKITGYESVPDNSQAALLKAVANQPISVSIDAGGSDFQVHSSGVFTGRCGTELDHGVTAVGYGETSDGSKYWLVKNSWGTSWGEEGYIRMQRDTEAEEGLCGIAMDSSHPTA